MRFYGNKILVKSPILGQIQVELGTWFLEDDRPVIHFLCDLCVPGERIFPKMKQKSIQGIDQEGIGTLPAPVWRDDHQWRFAIII